MANFKVVQEDPRRLQTQINGTDGAYFHAIRTDTGGRLDIRDLAASRDSIVVCGLNGMTPWPIKVDSLGRIIVTAARDFVQLTEQYTTAGNGIPVYSQLRDISIYASYTYFFTSQGGATGFVAQISPDGTTFMDDTSTVTVPSGAANIIVCNHFLRYIRLKMIDTGTATSGKIILQAQG